MGRKELVKKLNALSDRQFERIAPFLEADLESVDKLAALHREIEEGRRSADLDPLLDASAVYAKVREALSKGQ